MMEASSSKRMEAAEGRSPQNKVQTLPLLCIEAICKFTPTSKLVRLYSSAVPLPGAFWNFGVEAVLKKRRPFSLSPADNLRPDDALFDYSGAKVATIIHPEAFQFSPLCEFVENADIPFFSVIVIDPGRVAMDARLRCSIGRMLLPHLSNISKIALECKGYFRESKENLYDPNWLLPALRKVLPQLGSFSFDKCFKEQKMLDLILLEMLPEMTALKQLDVDLLTFAVLMRAASVGSNDSGGTRRVLSGLMRLRYPWRGTFPEVASLNDSRGIRRVLSGLNSMRLHGGFPEVASQLPGFLSDCCTQLTHLSLTAEGQLKPYLVALRALVNLNTLGLQIGNVNTVGMSFSEEEFVRSVLDLRLVFCGLNQSSDGDNVTIASLFPNTKTAALYFETLTMELCEKQVWPKLEKLNCFFRHFCEDPCSITQFLACTNLPPIVDLSSVTQEYSSSMLTAIYQAMQRVSVKSLLLRGLMHRDALPDLQTHIDFNGANAKVTAWIDRDLGEIIESFVPVSEHTDVRIVGSKENGENFTIRILHLFAKTKYIFD